MKRHQQIITTATFSIRKRKILFAFQLRIILKALTEINLASGHTKEDKNKEQLIILTKKSFVEALRDLNYCIAQSLWDGVASTNGNHSINKVDNFKKKITLLY